MPMRVTIDDEVARVLKDQAEPLVDSVNSVLRRLLQLPKTPQAPIFFDIDQIADGAGTTGSSEQREGNARSAPEHAQRSRSTRRRGKHARSGSRAPRGSLLDERSYWKPILNVLASSPDGSAPAREVVEQVGAIVGEKLTKLDREQVSSGGLRWHTRVMFARLRMKDAGLLKDDSPRGVWEISDLGRQALAEGRVEDPA